MWCAVLAALTVILWPDRRARVSGRLPERRPANSSIHAPGMPAASFGGSGTDGNAIRAGAGGQRSGMLPRVGIAQVIASAIARMKGGGTLLESFEEQYGRRFAVPKLTATRLTVLFETRRLPDESSTQIHQAASGVAAASTLSDELGCQAAPCLEAVLAAYRQLRLTQHLTAQAFAVPRATIGLLSVLPAATVALGELMGAKSLAFLLGSSRGLVCLALGGCCYVAGLAWVHALMKEDLT
ncbi:pilus assembly protein [Bifidobacterium sp. 82T25]|nr:pilus assembly protein [Bifidobacterium miconisargentati]